ncbi:2Fe-2S iron-sulfur cluster-binding protein [Pseudoalteromonas umbrosa]|uniref:2Fe-2S iron-sulfur cluster-binding protein n=1 Tax=Pseudoalteromonas umbrosa TaxID=3048489 RepID=UPI0024C3D9EC|nr:2Fe-2S iron-sulfur cluster-binding protein [Pseudoalteromonas sp. B95]MDK1290633.1 2Fe-2S iron-sulfur cluster-binding protein [Pseudoalteromonas sp. B95]
MHRVVINSTNEQFNLPDKAYLTDAEELQVNGLKFGCRKGACGICVIEIVKGMTNLSSVDKKEDAFLKRLGHCPSRVRLACKCQLLGDIEITPV